MTRSYPDEPPRSFPRPPIEFTDKEGREIEIRTGGESDRAALVSMYAAFDPADRAQGIPPVKEPVIDGWLDTLLADECVNVVAWDGDEAVGHAILVPDGDGASELAVFVLHDYQNAGIGTRLLEGLLGRGQAGGVENVWLTVERWNNSAIALYRKLGFETSDASGFELEMAIRLLH